MLDIIIDLTVIFCFMDQFICEDGFTHKRTYKIRRERPESKASKSFQGGLIEFRALRTSKQLLGTWNK